MPVAEPLLTLMLSAEEVLTSPVEEIVAERVANALVAIELMIEVLSDDRPLASVDSSVCRDW